MKMIDSGLIVAKKPLQIHLKYNIIERSNLQLTSEINYQLTIDH